MRLEIQFSRMYCQMFSTGFNSGALEGSGTRVMLAGTTSFLDHKFLGLMPARLVHQDEGMRPGCNRLRNLLQVQGHALGRAAGQNQARALALGRTDGPEEVGRGGPLVLGGGRARAAFGPASRDLVLLPDPGLIGEPDLDHLAM